MKEFISDCGGIRMNAPADFTITYRQHFCGLRLAGDEQKEEITIRGDGNVVLRRFVQSEANSHWRVVERYIAKSEPQSVFILYRQLKELLFHAEGVSLPCDLEVSLTLVEHGIRISVDGTAYRDEINSDQLIQKFLKDVEFSAVKKKF